MNKLLLPLLLIATPTVASANTSNFTSGSMTQTTTATQEVSEVIAIERFGGAISTWNGDNVKAVDANGAATGIVGTSTSFLIVDDDEPWQLEIVTRAAGLVETQDITRTIETTTTTNTLSVFAQ